MTIATMKHFDVQKEKTSIKSLPNPVEIKLTLLRNSKSDNPCLTNCRKCFI